MLDKDQMKLTEDKVVAVVDGLSDLEHAILYKLLYSRGLRISDIPTIIRAKAPQLPPKYST